MSSYERPLLELETKAIGYPKVRKDFTIMENAPTSFRWTFFKL